MAFHPTVDQFSADWVLDMLQCALQVSSVKTAAAGLSCSDAPLVLMCCGSGVGV